MEPCHEGQSSLLALELKDKARALIPRAGQVKSPRVTQKEAGLLKFFILWSAQGTRSGRSGLTFKKNLHSPGS